ncbi:MAG TPA: outer membrane protein assembly factor BamD [Acidiferrobacter sp.]|nr:outer membrane protein assembly factor BamD [Acidiferrobacter sp.]
MRYLIRLCLIVGLVSLVACGRDHHKAHHWPASHLYATGVAALKNGQYEHAITSFQDLEATYPYGRYATQAEIVIAYAYYKAGEPQSAIDAAKRFIRLHPTDPRAAYAYYLKGLIDFSKNRSVIEHAFGVNQFRGRDMSAARAAIRAFEVVVTKYPHSRYATDSAERINYLTDILASNNISIARYYYIKGAYVATVSRCKLVVEHYPHTPAVADALGLMAMAYERMGMTDLSGDAARVLALNFPASPYLAKLRRAHVLPAP